MGDSGITERREGWVAGGGWARRREWVEEVWTEGMDGKSWRTGVLPERKTVEKVEGLQMAVRGGECGLERKVALEERMAARRSGGGGSGGGLRTTASQ